MAALSIVDRPASRSGQAPDYGRYPEANDLTAFLEDAGFTNLSAFRLDGAVLAGIEDLESRCMRHFLAGRLTDNTPVGPSSRTYDPPTARVAGAYDPVLDLGPQGDLARLDSVAYMPNGTLAETWTAGKDYRPLPANALSMGEPITSLQILKLWWAPIIQPNWSAIQVTGLWGFSTRIPPDVWWAMLSNASLGIFSAQFKGAGVPVGIKRWVGPDGISTEYDATMLTARLSGWQNDVQQTVVQNARWGFG